MTAHRERRAAALDDLRDRALAWGDASVRVVAEAAAGLPWYPGQVILEDHADDPAPTSPPKSGARRTERELLHRLLEGSPVGRTRDAAPGTPPDRPVPRLLAAGLLHRLDAETVILPRQVGQVLRGEEAGPVQLSAPAPGRATSYRRATSMPLLPEPSSTCCTSSTWSSKH